MAGLISASVPRTLHQDMEMQGRKSGGKCEGPVVVKDFTSPHCQTCIEGEAMGGEVISTTCDAPPLTPSKTQVVYLMHFVLNIVLCIFFIFYTMYTCTAFFSKYFFHHHFFLYTESFVGISLQFCTSPTPGTIPRGRL